MTTPSKNFRVIVVGAGVAGLTASHCLQKANIDHVVLERGIVAPAEGSSIAIHPHGARILAQIGCLKAVEDACVPMSRSKNLAPNGKVMVDSGFFDHVRENHGHGIHVMERREFLQILYDGLPDKSYIKTGHRVVNISETADGVEIELKDGTIERGDLVIGCDGVNSNVREAMWNNANRVQPGVIPVEQKMALITPWTCLIGISGPAPEIGERDMTVVHNDRYSFQILAQPDKVYFFVTWRLDQPSRWPKRLRFGDEEAEAAAQSVFDHPISDTLTFGELWKRRIRSSLITVEQVTLERWYFGRIVLAGDAAHKVTPNIALGGNATMESIVVLCNQLNRLVNNKSNPDLTDLTEAFEAYQQERYPRMKSMMEFCEHVTKFQCWNAPLYKVAAYLLPYLPDRLFSDQLAKITRGAPKLDYVDVPANFNRGKVPYADEEETAVLKKAKTVPAAHATGQLRSMVQLFSVCGALSVLYSAFYFMLVR